ncbi:DUF3344 domain-containing protein [Methanobrevibacter sp.]|uniref:DUF3344 domain-containing protein n=1 Tax=Methanobrevibacter sp. TaxID=66852 RepID=UPI003890367B
MKFRNNLLFFTIFVFLIIISSGIVFAEDANPAIPQIETGEVSGDVDIATAHPFASKVTSEELVYVIPENVSEIKSAYAVVNTYSGSGAPDRGLTTNISLTAGNTTEVLEYANLTFVNNTANDPVVYQITDFTTKQYSDYQTLVDITDNIKGLSAGDTITISVNNTELEGYVFDGRIKVIALVLAYDDDDNDKMSYWLNIGQAWTKGTLTTMFNTKDFDDDYDEVTLDSIALSSKDAVYTLNDELLSDPDQTKDSMYIYDVWDITENFELGKDTNFTYDGNGSSYKGSIQLLKIYTQEEYYISASIALEYKYDTAIYAGVENTLTINVKNGNEDFNGSVILLSEDEEVDSSDLTIGAGESATIELIDPTIRPIDETTVNGANNTLANYTLIIVDDEGNVLNSTNVSFKVLYDGYLGKDFEYPGPVSLSVEIPFTGDVIVLNTTAYSAGGATNRIDEYDVDLADGTVNTAFLYVPYNWDKNINDDFNTWNTTFNNQIITPASSYRDQSNLGSSGKYGYGLVVYEVTDLVVDGINTFEFNKTAGNAAVYPTNLIILTDNDDSTFKIVYILEEADLLSKSYNKNLDAGFYSEFNIEEGNATLYVFAASAQKGEGNLIINDVNYTDVWSGTSNSFDTFSAPINETEGLIYFEATGSTILALHKMIVIESDLVKVTNNLKPEYSGTVYAGVENTLTLTVTNEASNLENVTVDVLLDDEELDSFVIDSLSTGNSVTLDVVDPTIRPVTAQTVNGNDNEKANYTVIIKDAEGNIIDEANYSFVVLYNGYLGKDFEYPKAEPLLIEIPITGDVIVLNTTAYSAGGATNRTDEFEVDLANGTVNTALLYVSYNWDKVLDSDFNSWNTTFNGQTITPIASYRDQSNLGTTYAKYGYGLVVYDVTDLVIDGTNTFEFNKTKGNAAVYPSNLIILTDDDESDSFKIVYLYEEADLLSKSYNKDLDAGFYTEFNIEEGNATLFVFAASAQAGEGNLIVNDVNYTDVWSGTSNSLEIFSAPINGTDVSVYFEATGATILGLHQMIVVESDLISASSDLKPEYSGTVYAGVENTLTLTVANEGKPLENVTVEVYLDEEELDSFVIDSLAIGESNVTVVVDPTIRPVTAQTVNGNDNEKANYTVIIKDAEGNIIDEANYTFVILYNGYLGKDFEYPNAEPLLIEIPITGDVIILNTTAYSAGGATNRTDEFEVDLANGTVNTALLYVSYNWDKAIDGDFNSWNTTFNGQTITPTSSYRDQSNLGTTYAKYGYGLVVYDVTDLIVDGTNTFELNKIKGNAAVYPSNLIVLTDKENATVFKTVYLYEEADLLSKSYNKNLDAGFYTEFEIEEGNATLYVFAASAQKGEGNLIINDENYTNVWSGTSNSLETFSTPINGTDVSVYFEATGATILGLHQMIVVEHGDILVVDASDVEKYYKGPERFYVTVTTFLGIPVVNQSVNITINGVTYTRTTNENGTTSIPLGLNSGVYDVITAVENKTFDNVVTILPTINGDDLVKIFRNATQYYATFTDSEGNPLAAGTEVTFNINGVMYNRKTNENGTAKLNINLEPGTYILTAINPATGEMQSNNVTVLPNIVSNDLVKYYRNASQYVVTVLGEDGNPVGAGENVTFNINGVFYTRTTNASGQAKLNINLEPGNYIITAVYNGCSVANNITVLPVLTAEDLTKKYGTPDQFVATLVDGQGKPYANQNVTFNVHGVFYNRTTNSDGQAKLNINLQPGEYIITSTYEECNIANTIKVTG